MVAATYAISRGGMGNRLNAFSWLFCYAHSGDEAIKIAKENGIEGGEIADLTARRREWIAF